MPVKLLEASLGTWDDRVAAALGEMSRTRLVPRLWAKDHRLWKPDPTEITNRLGWLTVTEQMQARITPLRAFAKSVRDAGFRDVVLLGMGGSSLGPEVLRCTFGSTRGFPRLTVLDSTVPGAVRAVTEAIKPAKTLFILASKSGGTIEVGSLFAHFWQLVQRARGNGGGSQFVAITDPGTGLTALAQERGFRTTFTNPPDIGGRYSVLSYFGLVPAVLQGIDLERLLSSALDMAKACGPAVPPAENPGARLGAILGLLGAAGRDKITIVASPAVQAFGLWAEQLLAESTGKEGKGLVPIADEPLAAPACYGDDRLFVHLRVAGDKNAALDRRVKALAKAGQPVVQLALRDRYDLAAQFFLWEFATAVAGHYLGIHPFDQPNVQESKENTGRILAQLQGRRRPTPHAESNGNLRDLLLRAAPGRYFAVLAYLPPSAKTDAAIRLLRKTVLSTCRIATTAGYGPRYLHSTGQLHKGGPPTGLFLQLTEQAGADVPIPGAAYTFRTLAGAQAEGDLQSLQRRGHPVVRLVLGREPGARIRALAQEVRRPATRAGRKAPGRGAR
jgi:glucose-6-phosphate isomerase/transaldolase/glucose-6-phosphate isomerase